MNTNQSAFTIGDFSLHASQQKKVMNPKYASYKVAIDQGLAANDGSALHKLCCRLVRMVITTMNAKINPNSAFRKSFTLQPFDVIRPGAEARSPNPPHRRYTLIRQA